MNRVGSRRLLASLTGVLLVAGALVGATSAAADSIQVQSYQRAGQSAACTALPGETPWLAAWGEDSSWHPTWEQWANGGKGGWTCTRSITWAFFTPDTEPTHPSAGCIERGFGQYVNFQGGWYLAAATAYEDASCLVPIYNPLDLVYAPVGYDATTLCVEAFGPGFYEQFGYQDVYVCAY